MTSVKTIIPTAKNAINLLGQRFGFLIVTTYHPHYKTQHSIWECLCDCGQSRFIKGHDLRKGEAISCNKYKCVLTQSPYPTRTTPEYISFNGAKTRCHNPNNPKYHLYGGRGIEFRFNSFEEFFTEVGLKPTPEHSIDRIDTNGHYEKGNVRWATRVEQSRNRRQNRWYSHEGQTRTFAEWAEIYGLPRQQFYSRIVRLGWCHTCACTIPLNGGKCPH